MGCQQAAPTPAPAPVARITRTETRAFRTPTRAQLDGFTFDIQWRYLPAEIDGRKVAQLVQTAIAR